MYAYQLEKKLIEVLKGNRDRYLAEQALLSEFGLAELMDDCTECSQDLERTIDILRLQGYEIDGSPERGWTLVSLPDQVNFFELESELKTSFLGKTLFAYRIIGSTNSTAKMLADSGAADGTLIVAEEQSGGRGRRDNSWYSPAGGGIWASLILRPGIRRAQLGSLGLLAALSICLTLEEQGAFKPKIKWPNDIYLNGKKVAGILCEAGWLGSELKYVILGCGVNVNIPAFPAELAQNATSLSLASAGKKYYRTGLLSDILDKLEAGYFQFLADGLVSFLPRVQVRDFLRDRRVTVSDSGESRTTGVARGIDESGALLLEVPGEKHMLTITQGYIMEFGAVVG
ncbi:MAG: biotin--[acetyl-CoA-carboxylase] ligase [Candidatus Glassbacteria bacterium GWA2_58_10]|uniref:Bifunctional ligase/repressor BirA n=1 Tax=Candidatus Glassbacteria bacterium GWA2_58_10 TaxID=1817865 RepID=A0A1F5YGQ2_9BACT|nr:MAG: biotin--[acetyl-CoA-carboxylase] ligase [Candidatus Glassbacteria bacterium GWA2_58_10]